MALTVAVATVLLMASVATAKESTKVAIARMRLTTYPKVPVGCTTLGTVDDD